jgi:hemerythrin
MDAKYVWTQEMSVGVQELDEQHQHLFQLLNDVVGLTMEHPNAKMEEKLELLDGIMDYDLYHLKYEEERMHEFDCGNPMHLRAHEWYREHIQGHFNAASIAIQSMAPEADDLCRTLATFSGDWHLDHIPRVDKSYTQCFHDHGLR